MRRPPSVRLLLVLLLALGPAACRSPTSPPASANVTEAEPLGVATSPCGRYVLRLDVASWEIEPAHRPRLSLQMSFQSTETEDRGAVSAAFPVRPARVTDLVTPDGAEFREGGLKGLASVEARWGGMVHFHGLEVYRRSDRLRRLRVECRVLRVLSWRIYSTSFAGPGDEREILCPPFHLGLSGDETAVRIAAWCGEDLPGFPAAQRELFNVLGHDWVATGAVLHDASGRTLRCTSAAGSGGSTVAAYSPDSDVPEGHVLRIDYPVAGSLCLPERWVVEVVPFEFTDLPLERSTSAPQRLSADPIARTDQLELPAVQPSVRYRRR